ncbi:hypothetical protein OC835_000145 [Tilletia horrida]|nr:hypothetical protein OC835_000145 [Tilletia horrida]
MANTHVNSPETPDYDTGTHEMDLVPSSQDEPVHEVEDEEGIRRFAVPSERVADSICITNLRPNEIPYRYLGEFEAKEMIENYVEYSEEAFMELDPDMTFQTRLNYYLQWARSVTNFAACLNILEYHVYSSLVRHVLYIGQAELSWVHRRAQRIGRERRAKEEEDSREEREHEAREQELRGQPLATSCSGRAGSPSPAPSHDSAAAASRYAEAFGAPAPPSSGPALPRRPVFSLPGVSEAEVERAIQNAVDGAVAAGQHPHTRLNPFTGLPRSSWVQNGILHRAPNPLRSDVAGARRQPQGQGTSTALQASSTSNVATGSGGSSSTSATSKADQDCDKASTSAASERRKTVRLRVNPRNRYCPPDTRGPGQLGAASDSDSPDSVDSEPNPRPRKVQRAIAPSPPTSTVPLRRAAVLKPARIVPLTTRTALAAAHPTSCGLSQVVTRSSAVASSSLHYVLVSR